MKTIITTNPAAKTGYEIRFDGQTHEIVEIVDNGKTLKLPENPSNRKYFSIEKVQKAGGEIELTYKETKTLGPKTNDGTTRTVKNDWTKYLTEEEKVAYEELKAKAERRAQIAALKAQLAADQARLAELEAQA